MELRFPRLELRDVEQVVDQCQQVLAVLGNDVDVLPLLAGEHPAIALEQQLREPEN